MDNVVILITGAGAPGTVGTLEALRHVPFKYKPIGIDIDQQCANRFLFDAFHVVPEPEKPEFITTLQEIVKKEKVSVVLPQVTRELVPLATSKKLFAQLGCQILVNDLDAIKIINDKYKLMQLMKNLSIKVPEHYLISTKRELKEAVQKLGYPTKKVVVKPPVSSGMRGLRILIESSDRVSDFLNKKPHSAECSLDDLLGIFPTESIPDLLVCEFLPGIEVTVDCLGKSGEPRLIIPRTRDQIRTGITFRGSTINESEIIKQCTTVIGELRLDSIIGFQFKYNEKRYPMILECNPRIQGTMVLGAFSGANVILGAVCQALGLEFRSTQKDIEWGVQLSRYWGGIVSKKDELRGRF